jgi:hypothetical protein
MYITEITCTVPDGKFKLMVGDIYVYASGNLLKEETEHDRVPEMQNK